MMEIEYSATLADQVVGFHYKSAFVHGFKNGCEYMREVADIDLILEEFASRELANDANHPA